jgi:hypothetical protein
MDAYTRRQRCIGPFGVLVVSWLRSMIGRRECLCASDRLAAAGFRLEVGQLITVPMGAMRWIWHEEFGARSCMIVAL